MIISEEILKKLAEDPVPVLNRGYRAQERIKGRWERIARWRQIAAAITVNPENSGGGSGGSPSKKTENCVIAIMELEEEIKDEIADIAALERETVEIIDLLVEDPNYKAILEYRYVGQKRWEQIAVDMNYTLNWVVTLHKRALVELRENAAKKVVKCG